MEAPALMSSTLLHPHTRLPPLQKSLPGSILLHIIIVIVVWGAHALFSPGVMIIGTGAGGGQGAETVRVALTGALDGGNGELFKPSLRPEPQAAPLPEAIKQAAEPAAPDKDDLQERSPKAKPPSKTTRSAAAPERPKSRPASNQIPRETAPGAGGAGPAAGAGGGFGGGQGIHIGGGSGGDGLTDSWYARQVEKRIGENWLRSNFESLAGRRLTTIIRFDILPEGRIDNVVIEQRSGVTFYDLAAERAVRSSNPLPRPPAEFQNRAIRFVCYFEYPPPSGGL